MSNAHQDNLSKALLENSALDLYPHILGQYTIADLLELCRQTEHYRLAFRAAWTLEHILLRNDGLLSRHAHEVTELYGSTENESSLRSTSKLVMQLLARRMPLSKTEEENIMTKTFYLMEKESCPVALLVNCWDILHLLSCKHEWISGELKTAILFHLEKNPSAASKSRGAKILGKLK